MASSDQMIFSHNYNEYSYQQGWDNVFLSPLYVNCWPDKLVYKNNSNMFIDVDSDKLSPDNKYAIPAELKGTKFKAFREVKICPGKYILVTMHEIEPVCGRQWVGVCDCENVINDEDAFYDWKCWFCKNKDKSDALEYRWVNLTDPYYYITKSPVMLQAYEGIDVWAQINAKLNLITKKAELNIDVGFIRINDQSRSSSSFNLIDYRAFCDSIYVKDIDWNMGDTTVFIDQKIPTNLNEIMGYSGLHCTCHSNTIGVGRCHDPNNLNTYGGWPTSKTEIFSTNNVIHIQVHKATYTSYID